MLQLKDLFKVGVWFARALGAMINSAIYLLGVAYFALHVGAGALVWKAALAAAGVAYLGYLCQMMEVNRYLTMMLVLSSNVLGVAAGLALLFH